MTLVVLSLEHKDSITGWMPYPINQGANVNAHTLYFHPSTRYSNQPDTHKALTM